jgi:hypothetical protein
MIPFACGINFGSNNFILLVSSKPRKKIVYDPCIRAHTHLELSLSILKMMKQGIENSPLDYISNNTSEEMKLGVAMLLLTASDDRVVEITTSYS